VRAEALDALSTALHFDLSDRLVHVARSLCGSTAVFSIADSSGLWRILCPSTKTYGIAQKSVCLLSWSTCSGTIPWHRCDDRPFSMYPTS
jgi:hypothetical protein